MSFSAKRFVVERLPPRIAEALRPILDSGAPEGEGGSSGIGRMAASAFVTRITSAALAYVSQVMLARWMGGYEYGIFVVVWTLVITFGAIFCFGLEQAVVRLVREYIAAGDWGSIRGLVLSTRLVSFGGATLVAGAGVTALMLRPDLVEPDWRWPVMLAAVCLPIYSVAELQDGMGRAWSWPDLAFMPTFIWRPLVILALMGVAFFAGLPMTAVNACLAAITATWATTLVQMVVIGRRIDRVVERAPRRHHFREWARLAAPILLVDTFFVLLNGVDVLVVGHFARPEETAVYFATVKTLSLVHFVYYASKTAAAARFAALWHAEDRDGLAKFVDLVVKWTFWASFAMSMVMLAFGKPLLWLFGHEFTSGYGILFVLVVGVLARASVGPGEALLTMAGQQDASALVYGLTFLTSLLFNSLLVPIWGIWGAAAGTTLAMILESVVVHLVVRRRLGLTVFALKRGG
mgnify:CR=1 FL=1